MHSHDVLKLMGSFVVLAALIFGLATALIAYLAWPDIKRAEKRIAVRKLRPRHFQNDHALSHVHAHEREVALAGQGQP